ncbi:hypothetical protein QNI19_10405 [Cytophagaceae bacterium DM2B3-1]|uniref:DUF1508 domain-containing protein n=1 Tax=Xanthocytophaga flava TaxID=3048013 RepID=A0ABT7CII6_9BACT|nr:hypothetical protein [Xanthocytophaga flavus]MDJ1493341.1 hypothetical protein [Xanthocytophaga flavus]
MNLRRIAFNFKIDNHNLYRIAWREKATGIYWCGSYTASRSEAESIVRKLNVVHPEFENWIESNSRLN